MGDDTLINGYAILSLSPPGPSMRKGVEGCDLLIARFLLHGDVKPLFPYLNAVAEQATFYEKPLYLKFMMEGCQCALYPDGGAAAPFESRNEAEPFMDRLVFFLNDIWTRRQSISPNPRTFKPVSVIDIYKVLPQTNCRECGYASCMAFAAALSRQETLPGKCPDFVAPLSERAVYPVYDGEGNLSKTVAIDINTQNIPLYSERQKASGNRLNRDPANRFRQSPSEDDRANSNLPAPLTRRELEVLQLVADGSTNTEISRLLGISAHTVKSHVINIFNKLGVNDRTQAAVWASRHGFV